MGSQTVGVFTHMKGPALVGVCVCVCVCVSPSVFMLDDAPADQTTSHKEPAVSSTYHTITHTHTQSHSHVRA